jgi:proline iminopeptidase
LPFTEANGIRIAYDTFGNPADEAVVLIAGLSLQLISWPESFCNAMAGQGYYVIRFDNRDCGLSTKMDHLGKPNLALAFFNSMFQLPHTAGYTVQDMAADTTGLLDALGIARAHLVGASMGGIIAQIVATAAPDRVLTLTSMMSTTGRPGLPGPSFAANSALLSRPKNPRDPESLVAHLMHTYRVIGSPAYPTPEPLLRSRMEDSVRRNVCARGMARQMAAVAASGDRSRDLRAVRAPTLVIHGTSDPLVPVACGRDTARVIPGAILHEVQGMGHDLPPQLEQTLAELMVWHFRGELIQETRRA